MRGIRALGAAAVIATAAAGCQLILGIHDSPVRDGGAGGGGGTTVCKAGATQACYEGKSGTEDAGICHGGTATCNEQGTAWGSCEGQQVPKAETCASSEDEDCDGKDCLLDVIGMAAGITVMTTSADGGVVMVMGPPATTVQLGPVTITNAGQAVVKMTADGTFLWGVQATGGWIQAIATDASNNVYVAGMTRADMQFGGAPIPVSQFVVKLDANGGVKWTKPIAGLAATGPIPFGGPTSLTVAPDGDVVVAGNFTMTPIDVGEGPVPWDTSWPTTSYIAKLNALDGSGSNTTSGARWTLTFRGAQFGYGYHGPFLGSDPVAGQIVVVAPVAAGTTIAGASLGSGTAIMKLKPDASWIGPRMLGNDSYAIVVHVAVAADGTVLLTGGFYGTIRPDSTNPAIEITAPAPTTVCSITDVCGEGFVIALNANGSARLAKAFGTTGHGTSAVMDGDGNVLLAGTFSGKANLGAGQLDGEQGTAILLAKFKPDGSLWWNRAYAHATDNALWPDVAALSDGTTLLGGVASTWPLDFGTGPLNMATNPSVGFLARFAP